MALFTTEINDVVSELDRQFDIFGSQSDRIWINNGVINKRVTEKDFNEIYIYKR